MKVILISGKAEAGKTTTAGFIKQHLKARHKVAAIVPYGDYVKHTAKLLFDWDGKKDEQGRQLLQHWGTDIVRAKEPDFWVDHVIALALVADEQLDYLIVDDCRFPNEIDAWKIIDDYPVTTIRVERPGWENSLTPEQRQHPSETSLDDWEFDITISATDKQEIFHAVRYEVMPKIL